MESENHINLFRGLSGHAIIAISLLLTIISLILSLFFTQSQKHDMEEELIKRAKALANNLAYNSQYLVFANFREAIQPLINGVMNEEDIIYTYIVDRDSIIIGHSDTLEIGKKKNLPFFEENFNPQTYVTEKTLSLTNESIIEILSPIEFTREISSQYEEMLFNRDLSASAVPDSNAWQLEFHKDLIGMIYLGVSTKNLDKAISKIQKTGFIITFGIIIFGIFLTIITMTRFITYPIRKLMNATKIVASGDLNHHVEVGRKYEIEILAQLFNQMTHDLKKSREKIENWNKELEAKVFERTRELSEKHKELTQYSRKLKRAYEELKTLDKAKDDFLALVSHELRTPLSSIVAYTEVLLDGMAETEEDEKNYLEIIKNESDRLTRLINSVLDLSKMEAGRMPFDFKYVKLSSLVNASINGLYGAAGKHNQRVINKLEDSSITVFADSDKIIQVLSNILSNAIKFTPDGGVITISGKVNNNMTQVSISDTGSGIKKDDFDKVFDKFQQIEDVNHHSEGTGLGMPISKIIIENHKGKIWFESEVNRGATFHFTLPLQQEVT